MENAHENCSEYYAIDFDGRLFAIVIHDSISPLRSSDLS